MAEMKHPSLSEANQRTTTDPRAAFHHAPLPAQNQEQTGSEEEMRPAPDYGLESYRGHGRLKDRHAFISGADSGIGRAVALAFAREGAHVAINYFENDADAQRTERMVRDESVKAVLVKGDISDDAVCRSLVDRTAVEFGRIDILVNNSAIQGKEASSFDDFDPTRVEQTFRVNIIAMFNLVRHALPHMHPGAVIINTTSIQAYQPSPQILDYAASKGAVVTFSKGLALSLIERGIRVNCVAPGPVWTPLVVQSFEPAKVAKFGQNSPMGRPAQPAELAPAYVFLASDESSYVNGEVLGVTGGKLLA